MNRYRRHASVLIIACLIFCSFYACADASTKESYDAVAAYVNSHDTCAVVLAPEGEAITVFNPSVKPWIDEPLDAANARRIRTALSQSLSIPLNARGFAPAASRALAEGEKDTTNYDAIWVRDNVWAYHALAADPARQADARRLILALLDYYATPAQLARFDAIIADPSKKTDQMAMPHIRFDGTSSKMNDVMVNGAPETWNHRQIDAHSILFATVGTALESGALKSEDLTDARLAALVRYPAFLDRIRFEEYEDAGAWEELPRRNTSSIGLATKSLQVWQKILYGASPSTAALKKRLEALLVKSPDEVKGAWSDTRLNELIARGMKTVRRQLHLGGESPDYPPDDPRFRRADAALLFIIDPLPLDGLTEEEMRAILLIVETLKRPCGTLRYLNDSYQSGNFWIREPSTGSSALTGDTSSKNAFLERMSGSLPDTEAQWFFDSIVALARLRLARTTTDADLRRQDLNAAAICIKRALGQLTGDAITADGRKVRSWQAPESINTVIIDKRRSYLASPIAPLNWAKAALDLALRRYEEVAQK